jgi:hypothetical protein
MRGCADGPVGPLIRQPSAATFSRKGRRKGTAPPCAQALSQQERRQLFGWAGGAASAGVAGVGPPASATA